jgi:hypothetical protein
MAVTADASRLAKTGTGVVGTALTTAGSVVATVPVVGWIVGGIMVAVGGALTLASSKFDPARAAVREQYLVEGASWVFSSGVARAQKWPEAKLRKEIDQATKAWQRNPTTANADLLAAYLYALQARGYADVVGAGVVEAQAGVAVAVEQGAMTQKVAVGGAIMLTLALLALVVRAVRGRR